MDYRHFYIIQNTKGTEAVNFHRLFERWDFGNEISKLMGKISHYVNFYDDVSDEESYELCSLVSKKFKTFRVDKSKLIVNKKVNRDLFEGVVETLLACYEEDKKVVLFEYVGFYYFVFGKSAKELLTEIKNHINIIDTHFFSRTGEKLPSLFSRTKFKVRKMLNVC
jgi:hypothetical protein